MTEWPVPSAEDQLLFFKNVQRLLSEGDFVASYKFALLHSLADLSVLKGDDTGAPLTLTTDEIAEQFVQLYWQQAKPFPLSGSGSEIVLKQNTGLQAKVINKIEAAHGICGGSLYRLRQDMPAWRSLVDKIATTVQNMPLWKLQTVGSESLEFLYENKGESSTIRLKAGVAYCFRAFYPALCSMFRSAWVDYLRRHNSANLGGAADLQEFMFGCERGNLKDFAPILREIQRGECFYCHSRLNTGTDVDHFIPWSRCRSDLGHNFVLVHHKCNNRKSDHLAFEGHLEKWATRNANLRVEMEEVFSEASLAHNMDATLNMARWAYSHTEQAGGQVWIRDKEFKHLDRNWRDFLVA